MFGFRKKNVDGFIDNVKDRRIGLLFLYVYSDGKYTILDVVNRHKSNVIFEVTEIFNDKILSKIRIDNKIYDPTRLSKNIIQFKVWVDNNEVHWLEPSTSVNRDNKLNEILDS